MFENVISGLKKAITRIGGVEGLIATVVAGASAGYVKDLIVKYLNTDERATQIVFGLLGLALIYFGEERGIKALTNAGLTWVGIASEKIGELIRQA